MATKGTVGQLLVEMRADLGKLRVDVKEMESVFKTSFTNVQAQAASFGKSLLTSLGLTAGIGTIVAFGKSVLDLGGKLSDLSASTGISVKALSGIKSTLEENGTSVEAFANGVFRLQKELGSATKEADPIRGAIKQLGLGFDDLRNSSPEELIKKVTDALGKQENPLNRNAIAFQFFGKTARELIPAVLEMAGKFDQLKKQGLDEADAKKLDQFGDAITRMGNVMRIVAAGPLADFIRAFERFFNLTAEGRLQNSIVSISEEVDRLGAMLETRKSLRKGIWGFFAGGTEADDKAQEERLKLLKEQLADAGGELGKLRGAGGGKPAAPFVAPAGTNDEMKKLIESIQKGNVALQAQVIEMNSGKEAAQNYILAQKEMEENSKGTSAALKKEQDFRRELTDQLRLETQAREDLAALSKAWIKDIDDMTAAQEKWADIKMDAETLGLDDLSKTLDEISKKYTDLIVKAQAAAEAAGASPEEIEAVTRRLLTARAREQVQARAGFTGEGVDAEAEAKARADQFGADLANSLTSGMRNTLLGIETGQQTLGEGMKNLVRNMLLELQGAVFDKGVLEPLKAIAAGFISGFVGALDDAANKDLKKWAEGLGESLKEWLGSGLTSIFGSFSFGGEGVAGGSAGLVGGMGYARGGMIPSFASGGLFIGHGGEFVMQKKAVDSIGAGTLAAANQSGKLPGGGATAVTVEINGDITPRQPNMTPDQVVRVTAGNITNDGMVMSAIEQRLRMRGR